MSFNSLGLSDALLKIHKKGIQPHLNTTKSNSPILEGKDV
jgi:hypothetical protein